MNPWFEADTFRTTRRRCDTFSCFMCGTLPAPPVFVSASKFNTERSAEGAEQIVMRPAVAAGVINARTVFQPGTDCGPLDFVTAWLGSIRPGILRRVSVSGMSRRAMVGHVDRHLLSSP